MDRLEAMSIVLVALEKGSFTAAAKALHMPLPTLSRKVNELEAYLGTKLFQRSTRKLALTEAGQGYITGAKAIMQQLEELERSTTGELGAPRGELVLTAPVLFGQMYMLPIVTDFLAAYPAINVRLVLSDQNLHLFDDRVDVAVRLGALSDSSLIATRVGSMETLVCASPKVLAAHGVPAEPEDLETLPCIVFVGPATATWSFRKGPTQKATVVRITPRLAVTSAEAAVQAALRHTGFTRVYRYHCADALRSGKLVRVLEACEVPALPVHLLHAPRGLLPQETRTFLDFAADILRRNLAALT